MILILKPFQTLESDWVQNTRVYPGLWIKANVLILFDRLHTCVWHPESRYRPELCDTEPEKKAWRAAHTEEWIHIPALKTRPAAQNFREEPLGGLHGKEQDRA